MDYWKLKEGAVMKDRLAGWLVPSAADRSSAAIESGRARVVRH